MLMGPHGKLKAEYRERERERQDLGHMPFFRNCEWSALVFPS